MHLQNHSLIPGEGKVSPSFLPCVPCEDGEQLTRKNALRTMVVDLAQTGLQGVFCGPWAWLISV